MKIINWDQVEIEVRYQFNKDKVFGISDHPLCNGCTIRELFIADLPYRQLSSYEDAQEYIQRLLKDDLITLMN